MKPTIEFIQSNFHKYNYLYFEGCLTTPRFELMRSKTIFGQFCYTWPIYKIRISTYYDREEKNILNTLIHEMIHMYIAQNKIRDNRPHGRMFQSIANRINREGGWHISRCSNDGAELQPTEVPTNKTYYLAAFKLRTEGKYFLISMNKDYTDYYKKTFEMNTAYFGGVVMFTSNDPKYEAMKRCRRRVTGHYISKEEYEAFSEENNLKKSA